MLSLTFCFFRPFISFKSGSYALIACYGYFASLAVASAYEEGIWLKTAHETIWMIGILWYSTTFYTTDHWTGARRWDWFRDSRWMRSWCEACERYFGLELVAEGELDPNQTYMFAYHPHGIYPFSLVWLPLGALWAKRYPKVEMDTFCAGILLRVPWVRDFGMWLGARDVTRKAIMHSLTNKRSAFLVPGGQAEMRESRSKVTEIVLVYRHKGFVRLAIQAQVPLVPIFCFGETNIFDNVDAPRMQNWFVRHLVLVILISPTVVGVCPFHEESQSQLLWVSLSRSQSLIISIPSLRKINQWLIRYINSIMRRLLISLTGIKSD